MQSPLPDSNRRPPPYHRGFRPQKRDSEQPLLARFSCNYAASSVRRILPSKSLEPPSKASNLSPIPIPRSQATAPRPSIAPRRIRRNLLGLADRATPGLHMIAGNIERLRRRCGSARDGPLAVEHFHLGGRVAATVRSALDTESPQPITTPARRELSYEHERKQDG